MTGQEMEIRLARLEGAYEQIDRRLVELRQDLDRHFAGIGQRFASIDQRFETIDRRFTEMDERIDRRFVAVDQKFAWVIGLILGTWSTTILTILFHH